jgi:hypothetical protein
MRDIESFLSQKKKSKKIILHNLKANHLSSYRVTQLERHWQKTPAGYTVLEVVEAKSKRLGYSASLASASSRH